MPVHAVRYLRAAACVGAWLCVGCSDEADLLDHVLDSGQLVVSVDEDYAPQSSLNDAGDLVGFDVDVAREVAERLGVNLEFHTPSWDELVAGNWEAQWDLSIGSMTPTETRAEVLWFTNAYYFTPAAFAVHTDNTAAIEVTDLASKVIGLPGQTTYEDYLRGELRIMSGFGGGVIYDAPQGVTLETFEVDADALAALALGDGVQLDAVMSSRPTVQNAINDGQPFRFVGTPAFYEPLVFALDQSRGPSGKFLERLNEVIEGMHQDGTLVQLSTTWYGIDLTTLTQGK